MTQEEKDELREETNDAIFDAAFEIGLTEKEKEFALLYLETYNPGLSYLKVYGGSRQGANSRAKASLQREKMKNFIDKAKEILQLKYDLNPSAYVEFLLRAANADIGDYLSFKEEEIEVRNKEGEIVYDPDTGDPLKRKVSKIRLKDSSEVDSTLVSKISQGREGIKIELIDKLKCWDRLKEYFGWEMKASDDGTATSNIIDAINKSAKSVWTTEEDADKDLEETLNG